jgi:hypothetical protein
LNARTGPHAMKILLLFLLIASLSAMAHMGARQTDGEPA